VKKVKSAFTKVLGALKSERDRTLDKKFDINTIVPVIMGNAPSSNEATTEGITARTVNGKATANESTSLLKTEANKNAAAGSSPVLVASSMMSSSLETEDTSGIQNRTQFPSPSRRSMPLSTRLVGSLAGGMYCSECRIRDSPTSNHSSSIRNTTSQDDLLHDFFGERNPSTNDMFNGDDNKDAGDDDNDDDAHHDYNLQELARQNSNIISPLVLAPMLQPHAEGKMPIVEKILAEYMATCKFYGCESRVNAGVLTTLRFALPSLRVSGAFHDADMLALVEVLLRHGNGPLRFIKRIDFSRSSKEGKLHGIPGFKSHGALALSKFLAQSKFVEEVRLQGNRLGPYGASAIFLACSGNRTLKRLYMRKCLIGEQGGMAFAELLQRDTIGQCGLVDVNLSVNRIGFRGCLAIEQALLKRERRGQDSMYVDTNGNLVLQEVCMGTALFLRMSLKGKPSHLTSFHHWRFPYQIMNGVTHGLGIVLAIVGTVVLSRHVKEMSTRHVISCAIYSASLLILYTSSTLFHSFFALQHTRYVFEVLDKCAIYILIAGSYTPFITITMINHFKLMVAMLIFIWSGCFLGIHVEYAHPTWPKKQIFSLSMYLGMGWVAAFAPRDVVAVVPKGAVYLILLGGIGYTAGVPFFLRDNFLDHSIWHLFVLSGSIFHWAAVYFYISYME